jgi:hypothetical protein
VVQRVRLTRLDVFLILIMVVAGASIWPVTSAVIGVLRHARAPRELDYQSKNRVHSLRVELKGFEHQLGKVRDKVVEKRLDDKASPADVERLKKLARDSEADVIRATLALAAAESAASRAYARDLRWYDWKTLGITMLAATFVITVVLGFFVLVAGPLLGLARLHPSWDRVLPVSGLVVLLAMGYQAGHVSGLIALVLLVTMGGGLWLLVSSFLRPPHELAQP